MQRELLKNKTFLNKQSSFIQALEGMGDVLEFETKRQKNKLVLDGLQKIRDLMKKFFEIQKKEPERFKQLMFARDFLDFCNKNPEEAQFRLAFNPDEYLIGYSTPINQLVRIYKAAIDSKNDAISKATVKHIITLLSELSKQSNNEWYIKSILQKLEDITRIAIKHDDDSMFTATSWYIKIVFGSFGKNQEEFDLTNIKLFDDYFFATIKYIVSDGHFSLFENLIRNLVDNFQMRTDYVMEVWDYARLILKDDFEKYEQLNKKYDVESLAKELDGLIKGINTIEDLKIWTDKFDTLKKNIESAFSKEQEKKANELEQQIKRIPSSKFKYYNLLRILFAVGAYCLFKHRASYIKYLWEYKQPSDSDAIWIGHDIVPTSLEEIVKLYLPMILSQKKLEFWEEHHGSEKYYRKYFLLLLARIFANSPVDIKEEFGEYNLPSIYYLEDIIFTMDAFVQLAHDLKKQKNLLLELGFNIEKLDEIFDVKLIPFLEKLKKEARGQIALKHK